MAKKSKELISPGPAVAADVSGEAGVGKPKRKNELAVELMARPEGASLNDVIAVTGWLPHTARAALTGLRKKGHAITKAKVDGVTRYSLGQSA